MDKTFRHIMQTLKEHEATHDRIDIGQKRRRFIRECYQHLKALKKSSLIGVRYKNRKSLTIRIVSKRLISCNEAPVLQNLIGIADVCFMEKCQWGFIIDLKFNLWRWVEK